MGTMMKTTVSTTANVRARGTVSGARADMGSMYFFPRARSRLASARTSWEASSRSGDDVG